MVEIVPNRSVGETWEDVASALVLLLELLLLLLMDFVETERMNKNEEVAEAEKGVDGVETGEGMLGG